MLPQWVAILFERWKILMAGALLAAAAAAIAVSLTPNRYKAEALIAPTRARTAVEFEPKIRTLDPSAPAQSGASAPPITAERRQAYADLVASGQIEALVIRQLAGTLPPAELAPGDLLGRVRGVLKPRSEIIAVQVEAGSPDAALAIANAWSNAYVDQVNRVYSGSGDGAASQEALLAQRDEAFEQFKAAQAALEVDLGKSPLDDLDRRVEDRLQSLRLLQSTYQAGLFDAGASRLDAQAARDDFRLAEVRTLNDLAQVLRRLEATRQSAQAMIYQSEAGGLGPSDAAALALLKAQLVSLSAGLPSEVQFQLPAASGAEAPANVRALAAGIERALADVSTHFEARRAAYQQKRLVELASLEAELRTLRADREAAAATRRELNLKRDLAWDTYSALARKVEERSVAEGAAGRELETASRATFAEPVTKRLGITVGMAALLGLALASAVVLIPKMISQVTVRRPRPATGEA